MPNHTSNYVNKDHGPISQRAYHSAPKIKIFEATAAATLETAVNAFLSSIALPLTDDAKYSILDIDYSICRQTTTTAIYSAILSYIEWSFAT